jgi:hypothetical protein
MRPKRPEDFAGTWQLHRAISDRRGPDAVFEGRATLHPAGTDGLDYQEVGQMRVGDGAPLLAERRYGWRFDTAGVAVSFADGRAFHRFVPEGHAQGSDHPCGADLYRVRYDFTRWPDWSATWEVTGPRKDYTSVSHYRRA